MLYYDVILQDGVLYTVVSLLEWMQAFETIAAIEI